jgi:hypothetical protein
MEDTKMVNVKENLHGKATVRSEDGTEEKVICLVDIHHGPFTASAAEKFAAGLAGAPLAAPYLFRVVAIVPVKETAKG